ncbi:hypothetical protein [Acinetobacter guillouiae]
MGFDKYAKLSDRAVDNYQALVLKEQKNELSIGLLPSENMNSDIQKNSPQTKFNTSYRIIYKNQIRNAAIKRQSKDLAEYFKSLPLILEDKKADINGLVKDIDIMNQVIEQNITLDKKFEGRLKVAQSDSISNTLSSGFRLYQYHIFKKTIRDHYPIIIKALVNQRIFLAENAESSTKNLNKKYFESYKSLNDAYVGQYDSVKITFSSNTK